MQAVTGSESFKVLVFRASPLNMGSFKSIHLPWTLNKEAVLKLAPKRGFGYKPHAIKQLFKILHDQAEWVFFRILMLLAWEKYANSYSLKN